MELFRQETALLQLSLDEIVARATRELWTCGDSDTVQRANTAIIRGAVWLPLSRCSRHGRKAATWQHRKCAKKSADSKRSLSPTKKADKVPAKPQSSEIRKTSVQLGAPTNVMRDVLYWGLSRAQRYVEGIKPRMTPITVKNRFSIAALPTTL